MTEERQAVKTLAENLVKAIKSVSANTPSKYAAYAATAGSGGGGGSASTILASKIVGLPAAFSSIINGVESSAAAGDAVAQQTLSALNHIAAGEFETITADTAMIEKVYATFADFITLVAEDAQIGDLDVDTIRAGLADIGLLNIGSASIDMAQIKRSSTQTAFIHESVQGKVYIDDLAVNDASIVNLSAGTVLINDPNGELVELYVDAQGNVSTRAVAYDGSDIINQNSLDGNTIINNTLSGDAVITNSLNGNKIISNSITTAQLNANEIFASQATVMNMITDNIEATRLFANQGFIPQLETTILSSATIADGLDLSTNATITLLQDSINLLATNANRTFIQDVMPMPTHSYDTWFDPKTEEHYVANGVALPMQEFRFGIDDDGVLYNERSSDYQFSINENGELVILVTSDAAAQSIVQNDIDFNIVDDRIHISVGEGELWNKIENVAFSNLKISVDGIVSEVYDSQTGISRIEQNAGQIAAVVTGDTAVPYVETSSIKIKEDKVEIKSTGDVDIKASNFSISFNTDGALANKSRVDISNNVGIKVSDSYGNYFQATSTKIGLYDIQDNPRLYMDNTGHAFFNGSLTLGGANNANGSMSVKNANGNTIVVADNSGLRINNSSGTKIGSWDSSGIEVYNSAGTIKQFYIDSSTGNATFKGALSAATGTFAGSLSAATGTFEGNIRSGTDESWVKTSSGAINFYVKVPPYAIGGGLEFYSSIFENVVYKRNASGGYDSAEDLYNGIGINTGRITWFDGQYIYAEFDKELVGIFRSVNINGNFTVSTGHTKSKVITTSQYSDRLLYCYETPSPLFGDVGEAIICDDGICYVTIDPVFAQTITTDNYQVFLQRYGEGDCWVKERHAGWFIVAGTPNLSFGWELKAKQADVDQLRLERNNEKFSVHSQSYGEDAANHIKELYNERTQQDEENK